MNKKALSLPALIVFLGITIAQLGLVGVAAISAPISVPISAPISSPTASASATLAPTPTPSSSSSNSSSSLSPAGGSGSAPVCNDAKPGSAPKLLSAVSSKPNQVTLTWSKASDPVSYYLIAYGLNTAANQYGNPNIGGAQTTTFTVEGLSGNVVYFFRVRAGNHCTPGDFSNVLSVKANGKSIAKPAKGFEPGILSVQKVSKSSSSAKPAFFGYVSSNNVLQRVFSFLGNIFNH